MVRLIPAILLAAGLPGIALAQDATPDVHVSYQDLDLHTAAGVTAFDRRLARAIFKVCPDDARPDISLKLAAARCRLAKRAEVAGLRDVVLAKVSRDGTAVASTR